MDIELSKSTGEYGWRWKKDPTGCTVAELDWNFYFTVSLVKSR